MVAIGQQRTAGWLRTWRVASPCLRVGLVAAGLLTFPLAAQESQPQAPDQAKTDPPAATPAPGSPGLMGALGRLFEDSKAAIDSHLRATQEAIAGAGSQADGAMKDATGAAQRATGAIVAMPGTRVINGRERCPKAANGAPDCQMAADTLCRTKGFESGSGVEVGSGKRCSARTWLSRRNPREGPCDTETFVTRAVCQ